jgi:hypothetical protein
MEGYLVFNKRDCFHWLLCSRYLELPVEIIYYITKTMFYDFELRRKLSNITLSWIQSRVVDSVFWKRAPITIWNSDRYQGKTTCAREIALYGLRTDRNVFLIDTNKRRSDSNSTYIFRNIHQDIFVTRSNFDIIETIDRNFIWFRPLTIGCKYSAFVDILIILIRDDGCIASVEEYLKNITYKQLVLLGDGKNSEWFKDFCKNNWFNVIQ